MPPQTLEQKVEWLHLACAEYNALGLGAVRDAADTPEQMHIYQRLLERQELTLRSRPMFLIPALGQIADRIALIKGWGVHNGFGDDWLKLEGLKFEMDRGSEAGALEQPYVNNPVYYGKLMWKADELAEVANYAVRSGWRSKPTPLVIARCVPRLTPTSRSSRRIQGSRWDAGHRTCLPC